LEIFDPQLARSSRTSKKSLCNERETIPEVQRATSREHPLVAVATSCTISLLSRIHGYWQSSTRSRTCSILASIIVLTTLTLGMQACTGSDTSGLNSANPVDDQTAATNTLTVFCQALQKRDYNTAYKLLPPDTQVNTTENQFIRRVNSTFGGIVDPKISPLDIWATPDPNAYDTVGGSEYSMGKVSITHFTIEALAVTNASSLAGHEIPASAKARVSWSFSNGVTTSDTQKSQFSLTNTNGAWNVSTGFLLSIF
jgi:hypothetical protein